MKKLHFFISLFFISYLISNAQIDKGYWMEGGNIALVFENSTITTSNSTYEAQDYHLVLNPNVGYFVLDRLAIGSDLYFKINFPNKDKSSTAGKSIDIGPYIRYYYINHSKPYNVFSQIGYNYGVGLENKFRKWNDNYKISIKNGFSYFLNESVAIEASINYYNRKFKETNSNYKSISNNINLSIGFQIHLTKKQ